MLNSQQAKQASESANAAAATARAAAATKQAATAEQTRQQTVDDKQTQDAAALLGAAPDYETAQTALDNLPAKIARRFQAQLPNDPSQFDQATFRSGVLHVAMNPEQQIQEQIAKSRNDTTEEQRQETIRHNQEMERLTGQLRDTQQQRAGQATGPNGKPLPPVAAHKQLISQLADQAISESDANGGTGINDAIKNVNNTNFYQNHPVGDNRGEVAKELQARKLGTVRTDTASKKLDKLDEDPMAEIYRLAGKTPPPAAGTPPMKPPAQQAQPAAPATAASSPSAPAKGARFSNGKVTVRWDGQQYIDEATGKPYK
jgi:hypothetical protein